MKKFFLVTAALILGGFSQAHASGCGGPEFYLESTKVLESYPFSIIPNFNAHLIVDQTGTLKTINLDFFLDKVPVPGSSSFFWHTATVEEGGKVQFMSPPQLVMALKTGHVEIVEDTYSIDCATVTSGVAKNIRIVLNPGIGYNLRTNYVPEVTR